MSNEKEIRNKIGSIKNTQKITKAMEMIAASKMHKTQTRMLASRPYAENMKKLISNLLLGNLEYKHSYLKERKTKRVAYLLISTDRGLCGGLNINLFKKLIISMKEYLNQNISSELVIIGHKGISFFESVGAKIIAQTKGIGDNPSLSKLIGPIKVILQAYDSCLIDKFFIVSNKFNNVMSQTPIVNQLLPISLQKELLIKKKYWDYLYEPDSRVLLNTLLPRYIESQVYQNVLENLASEQASRMIAMKAATDNAGDLVRELELIRNKVRQENITKELTEIISGWGSVF